jgi:predicted transglutaminase-like protease
MKLNDILDEWEIDSEIDKSDLGNENLKTPKLHQKYLKMYSIEKIRFTKFEIDYKKLFKLKTQYYRGTLDKETLDEMEWKPFQMRLLKEDVEIYIESDDQISELQLKLSLQKEIVSTLDSIIRQINKRDFTIRNSIDWLKFTQGQ